MHQHAIGQITGVVRTEVPDFSAAPDACHEPVCFCVDGDVDRYGAGSERVADSLWRSHPALPSTVVAGLVGQIGKD
jgi:hypothetical protein